MGALTGLTTPMTITTPGGPSMTCAAEQAARITATAADLDWVAKSWPDLHQLRLPGSRRRPVRRPMSRAARERADELVRIERQEQGLSVLGASAAPVHVGVLDALARLLSDASDLADRISMTAGVADPEPPSTAYDFDALGRILAHASAHLAMAADVDPLALDDAQETAKRMRTTLDRTLSDIVDGHVLTTVCAWCHGTTTHTPAGGERTLTVKVVAGEPLIVCTSDVCEPPSQDCGTWLFGKPAWREAEWEWLSRRLGGEAPGIRGETGTPPGEAVRLLLAALEQGPDEAPGILSGLLAEKDGDTDA